MTIRGKPNLDNFLAGGSSEAPAPAPVAQLSSRPAPAPAADDERAAEASPLFIAEKQRTFGTSIRVDEAAVKLLELYARVQDVRPHALMRKALREFALELGRDQSWQGKLPAEYQAAVRQYRDSLKHIK